MLAELNPLDTWQTVFRDLQMSKFATLHVSEVIKYLITTECFSQPESHIHTTQDVMLATSNLPVCNLIIFLCLPTILVFTEGIAFTTCTAS